MKKIFILFTVLLVLGSACKKDFLSVDEKNPNNASSVPASFILPAALNNTAALLNNPYNYPFIYEWYGLWSISGGYSQDVNMTAYNLLNSSYQGIWSTTYTILNNFDYIEKNSTNAQNKPYKAIAKIMKAYLYHNLVDCYGNVPYSEALKAEAGILKPKYDDQKAIYEDLVVQLDSAMNLIETKPADAVEVGANDIIYHGDMGRWAKFANTLKLKLLLQQTGMDNRASYISGAITTTSSVGYLGAGEGAWVNPGFLQSTGKMSPFWETFYKQDGSAQNALTYFMAGQDACDFLIANNDPRKLRFFAPYAGTSIQGNYFGTVPLNLPSVTSKIGPGMLKAYTQDSPILTDIESLFIQAEAAQRGLITGDVKALYEAAVTASVLFEGGPTGNTANATAYLAQVKQLVNFDATADKIKLILTQKWCALNGLSPMPVWTDYRRTGFPDFIHWSEDPLKLNETPPVRLLYPQTEISTNNDNVLLQGTINTFTSKIFWQNR